MLNLVLGRAGTGKTEYVRNLLCEKAKFGNDKLLLIVPEQFSYSCERAILETLDTKSAQNIEILSFTRLADFVNRKVGGINGAVLDDADEVILMLHTLNDMQDRLTFYKRQALKTYFAEDLIVLFSEFRKECVTAEILQTAAAKTENATLKAKLTDLALIFERYTAILEENSLTNADLTVYQVINALCENDIFSKYTICIDAFKGFTGQELEIIKLLAAQADDLYISLCADPDFIDKDDPSMIFGAVRATIASIKSVCKEKPNIIALKEQHRFKKDALAFIEKEIFTASEEKFSEKTEDIVLFSAETKYDECNFIAASIRKLMREKEMRLRDIAIITRDEDDYRTDLVAALARYGVPVYTDERQPLNNQPIIVLCKSLLNLMMSRELRTNDILTFLKTGFSPLTEEEAADLENYVFTWNIKGKEWESPFTGDPNGDVKEKDENAINRINTLRETILSEFADLRKGIDTQDGKNCKAKPLYISEKLFSFLQKEYVKSKFRNYAASLDEAGFSELAAEQNRIWEFLVDILNKLAVIQGEFEITIEMYNELFCAACDMATLGTLPHGLDEITIGSADRTRLSNPKVVFVCGVIEGEFPKNISTSSLLTGSDRVQLREKLGVELSLPNDLAACDERFIAYSAVTSATEKLVISYHQKKGADEPLSPSPLFEDIKNRFDEEIVEDILLDQSETDAYYYSETKDSAFSTYASGYCKRSKNNVEEYNTIKAVLEAIAGYDDRLRALETVINKKQQILEDKETARELFGSNIGMSASRAETFYNCPFQYFCKYGLKVYPRKKVAVNNLIRGSAVHHVLEYIVREHKTGIVTLTKDEQAKLVEKYLNHYLEENNITEISKDPRFKHEFKDICRQVLSVLERMIEEFRVSDFVPEKFESDIVYELKVPDGTTLKLRGNIDRVDTYEKDGNTYIRVVDYKTYVKEFRLDHVLAGLNMQMLIYLFAEREADDSVTPAGILYYNAGDASLSAKRRDISEEEKLEQRIGNKKSSGLFLKDTNVLNAMENDGQERFYKFFKGGVPLDNIVSAEEMGKVKEMVDDNLITMALALHDGVISVTPVMEETDKTKPITGCKYCDYANVCGFEGESYLVRDISKKLTNAEVFERLDGETDA